MDNSNTLPPLPSSDQDSMDKNKFDGFYKVRARDFWGDNAIVRVDNTPPSKCNHKFITCEGGVKCQKCHFGLMGQLEVRDEKLFYKGELIEL